MYPSSRLKTFREQQTSVEEAGIETGEIKESEQNVKFSFLKPISAIIIITQHSRRSDGWWGL